MKIDSNEKMPLITREKKTVLICFDEEIINNGEVTLYRYDAARVKFPYTYAHVVSAIIKERYDSDSMQAIINNHLADSESEEHAKEFADMQAWRVKAKEVAKLVIE